MLKSIEAELPVVPALPASALSGHNTRLDVTLQQQCVLQQTVIKATSLFCFCSMVPKGIALRVLHYC